ncbi:MAG: FAD-binding protein, partial [Bacteroidetes bacterium]
MRKEILIIGGGASGFFAAINIAESHPDYQVIILEKSNQLLAKVRISGGGRCNVTHACFEPKDLSKFYPRGEKEMLGAFHRFSTGDVIEWFAKRNVELKIEEDGRMFPVSDRSETIIDCFMQAVKDLGIEVRLKSNV